MSDERAPLPARIRIRLFIWRRKFTLGIGLVSLKVAMWRARRKLRKSGQAALTPASISTCVVRGQVWVRLTPHGSDGTIGDLYCALSGVDAVRFSRMIAKLAKNSDVA